MPKARKDHTCCLCKEPITKGGEYVRREVTPWNTPDNEVFWTYKAHPDCDHIFMAVGEGFDWRPPYDTGEWRDMVEDYDWEQKRKEGA